MITFEELKKEFIELLRDKSPCQPEYRKVLASTTEGKLLAVIYNNISWCIENKALTNTFLLKFQPENIFNSGLIIGQENTGLMNSGNRNSGNWNSGDSNSGDWNSGNRNSGNWNSGDCNSGDCNSGYRNSGNWNSGNWNSGDCNSGDCNSGYRNSGAFCTDPNPKLILFDVQTDILVRDWEQHRACQIMNNLNPNIWVWSSEMKEKEKESFPSHETTGGYLKSIPYKEAWTNLWGNLSDADKKVFTDLPHFNTDKFKEITGITV